MAESLYAKAFNKVKNAAEKRRKTLNASESKAVPTEAIEETPPQNMAVMICRLV